MNCLKALHLIMLPLIITSACTNSPPPQIPQNDVNTHPGQVSAIQVATGQTETYINVLRPRMRNFTYTVMPTNENTKALVKVLQTIRPDRAHWFIDQLHITGLQPNQEYELHIDQPKYSWKADVRKFKTLDTKQKTVRFALGSCSSDAYSHAHVRDLIWDKMISQKPDMIFLTGDIVYVDSYDFVSRNNITEYDLWTRYIDSIRSLKVFNQSQLIPIMAIWDDHDYGLNNADRNFPLKKEALKVFQSFFGSGEIASTYKNGSQGVSKQLEAFGQRFFFLDNRYDRSPPQSKELYGHLGKSQHDWLFENLKKSNQPAWIISGGQFFMEPFSIELNGKKKQLNEGFMADHPTHFQQFLKDLKAIKAPVVFGSGDIHFSEVLKIDTEMDYTTYELTSSPIHAFLFRPKTGQPAYWPNRRRVVAHRDYNYFLIESTATENGFDIDVASYGVKQEPPFFKKTLKIRR